MGTRKVVLTGTGYWMRVFEQNRDLTGFDNALEDIGGQTIMDIDLTADEFAKLKKAKFMSDGKLSPEDSGLTRVRLKRKWTEQYGGGAPEVLKADGTKWDYDVDGAIGNGSTVAVVVSVYDTGRKAIYGSRLEKIKVLEHVPYVKDDFAGVGMTEEPKAKEPSAPKTKAEPSRQELDDEIPF